MHNWKVEDLVLIVVGLLSLATTIVIGYYVFVR